MTPDEIKQITASNTESFTAALKAVLGKDGGSLRNPTNPTNASDVGDTITKFAKNLVGVGENVVGFGMVRAKGEADITKASAVVSDAFGKVGGTIGGLFGDAIKGTANYMGDSIRNWREFSKMGIDMYGDALGLEAVIRKNRLSNEEFLTISKTLGASMFNLGETTNEGIRRFSELNSAMLTPENVRNFKALGLQIKDVTENLGLVSRGSRSMIYAQGEELKGLAEAAQKLTVEMQLTAKLTGMTNKDQKAAMEANQNAALYQATLQTATKEQADGMRNVMNQMTAYPKEVQQMVQESIATGGITASKNAQNITAAVGADFANLVNRIGALSRSKNEEDIKLAKQLTTEQLMPLYLKGRNQQAELFSKSGARVDYDGIYNSIFSDANSPTNVLARKVKERQDITGQNELAIYNELRSAGKIDASGRLLADSEQGKKGTVPKGALTTQLYTGGESALEVGGKVLSGTISQLNNDFTGLHTTIESFLKMPALADPENYTRKQIEKLYPGRDLSTPGTARSSQQNRDVNATSVPGYADGTPGISEFLSGSGGLGEMFKTNFGSGSLAMLHGNEAVMQPGQLNAIIGKAGKAMQAELPNMIAGLQNGINTLAPQLNNVLSKIPAVVSSATQAAQNSAPQIQESFSSLGNSVSLSDLNDNLVKISKYMEHVADEMVKVSANTGGTAKNTKNISGTVY